MAGGDKDEALSYVQKVAATYDPKLRVATAVASGQVVAGSGGVLICVPHPDDESLCGSLSLRLGQEDGCPVTAVAITLGSEPSRKESRLEEFAAACTVLGWEWQLARLPLAFDRVTIENRDQDPLAWQKWVVALVDILVARKPELVLVPHGDDMHPTHIGTHHLCLEALLLYSQSYGEEIMVVETEFWRPLRAANLLVGVSEEDLALLVTAVGQHRGEICRHPYHAQLPFRMMDTVRRGSELLAGFGSAERSFQFGELYRLSRMQGGCHYPGEMGMVIAPEQRLSLAVLRRASL